MSLGQEAPLRGMGGFSHGQEPTQAWSLIAGREGGLPPAVRTMYCARAVEPLHDSKIPDPVCLTRPWSVLPQHAQIAKGQIPYRPGCRGPLSVRKPFSAKGLPLLLRKDYRTRRAAKVCRLYGQLPGGFGASGLQQPLNPSRLHSTAPKPCDPPDLRTTLPSPRSGSLSDVLIRCDDYPGQSGLQLIGLSDERTPQTLPSRRL